MLEIKQFDGYIEIHADKMEFIERVRYKDRDILVELGHWKSWGWQDIYHILDEDGIKYDKDKLLDCPQISNIYDNDKDILYTELACRGYIFEHNGEPISVGLTDAPLFVYNGKIYWFNAYERYLMTDLIYRDGYVRLDFARNFDREDLQNVCDFFGYDINEELESGVITIEQPLPCDDLPHKEE